MEKRACFSPHPATYFAWDGGRLDSTISLIFGWFSGLSVTTSAFRVDSSFATVGVVMAGESQTRRRPKIRDDKQQCHDVYIEPFGSARSAYFGAGS